MDALATQDSALVRHRHRQIVATILLQGAGHLDVSATVGVRLHDAQDIGGTHGGGDARVVPRQGREVDFKPGAMRPAQQSDG